MKGWAEGLRVHSRGMPGRELRPPKTSLAKASGGGRSKRRNGAHAWFALAAVIALAAVFLLFTALS